MHQKQDVRKIRLLDGSFSASLQEVVPDFFDKERPNWTFDAVIDNPEAVRAVHMRYIDAGVDDITSNTYHASLSCLREQGHNGKELIKEAVDLLKDVVTCYHPNENRRIWGSIGSYAICFRGQATEYTGSFVDTEIDVMKKMVDYHKNQIEAMKAAGLTDLLFETLSTTKEAEALCEALDGYDVLRAVICFSCQKDGVSIRHGEPFKDAVRLVIRNPKVVGFGINCTHPAAVTSLLESISGIQHEKEIFVYANSGKYEQTDGEKPSIEIILDSIARWVELGATVIGGCCGIGSSDISRIRKKIDDLNAVIF
ncbi:unnamed protein product [Nippostrongylus brasiliensis]|uniref:Hcy-binding domain-containing protein n=1 Tax=Nippostrongylus brasiliensis TaxID=27835 RepID=A0A0N4XWS3_NIPBR|nr:unnamed protein product [Nippostrongylus brasiliensis]